MTDQEKVDQLKRAVLLALDMRERQKAYFNHRSQGNLIEAKQAEAAFDKIGRQALHQALGVTGQQAHEPATSNG